MATARQVPLARLTPARLASGGPVLVGVILVSLVLSACGSDTAGTQAPPSTELATTTEPVSTTEPAATTEPTTSAETTVAEEQTTTMLTPPDDPGTILSAEAFVLAEQQYFGQTGQELLGTVERLVDGLPVALAPGDLAEDKQSGTSVVFVLPLAEIRDDVDGFYLLSMTNAGTEAIEIREASWQIGDSTAALTVVTTSGDPLEATWSYSLRPRMRPVFLADDDGSFGADATVLHVADFGPGPVSADAGADDPVDGLVRSTFTTPLWLVDQTPLAEACELVVDELGERVGTTDLQWSNEVLDDRFLDDVAASVEQRLPDGQQVNLVVEVDGREVIRGKRLQPFVRYPVTLLDSAQNPTAATLGCSISPS